MIYNGRIKAGRIELTEPAALPEGAAVRIEVLQPRPAAQADAPSLAAELLRLSGTVKGMPADASERHDHYIYGKRP